MAAASKRLCTVEPRYQSSGAPAGSGGGTTRPATNPIATISSRPVITRSNGRWPAPVLDGQQAQRDDPGDQPAEQHRQSEQQVQRNCPTDDLGQIGGHGNRLGLQPSRPAGRGSTSLPDQFRQRLPGQPAELGRQELDDPGRGGDDQHPHQQVAVPRPGLQVGGDVAGVDVGDGRDEGRSEQRERLSSAWGRRGSWRSPWAPQVTSLAWRELLLVPQLADSAATTPRDRPLLRALVGRRRASTVTATTSASRTELWAYLAVADTSPISGS